MHTVFDENTLYGSYFTHYKGTSSHKLPNPIHNRVYRVKAFSQVVRVGSTHPLPPRGVAFPPLGTEGGDTLACGGGDGGTQFRRRDRHSGTVPLTELSAN
jgi:hypothetical protein